MTEPHHPGSASKPSHRRGGVQEKKRLSTKVRKGTISKKYRLKPEEGGLYRLIANRDFATSHVVSVVVKKGDRGGLVSGPYNLSQRGRCWVEEGAKVLDQAKVSKDGLVMERATVKDRAVVTDTSWVGGEALVCDNVQVREGGVVLDQAIVRDGATVRSAGVVGGHAIVEHRAVVEDGAMVGDKTKVGGVAVIRGRDTVISGDGHIFKGIQDTSQ